MASIIQFNNFFNNIFNTLVRNVDPVIKHILAFAFFALGLYLLAKSFIVKYKGGSPVKLGHFLLGVVFIGISMVYTFY